MDAARQCAGVIVRYIVKRWACELFISTGTRADRHVHSSGKAAKNSTAGEAEYKALLEHLVRDLLTVVDLPDWPAAMLMLQLAIKDMVSSPARWLAV